MIFMPRCACAAKHTVVTLCEFVPSVFVLSVDSGQRQVFLQYMVFFNIIICRFAKKASY